MPLVVVLDFSSVLELRGELQKILMLRPERLRFNYLVCTLGIGDLKHSLDDSDVQAKLRTPNPLVGCEINLLVSATKYFLV